MKNIIIKLPDNSAKAYPEGITAQEVANSIGPGLARAVVVAKIDGKLKDLNYKISKDSSLELLTGETPEGHDTLLHSTAHLMAQAVKSLYPDAKFTIGPTIENGFYYDFDLDVSFSEDSLILIENKMKELCKKNQEIVRCEVSAQEAVNIFKKMGESYKVEIIEQINPEDTISLYKQSDFTDLCRGPHVSIHQKLNTLNCCQPQVLIGEVMKKIKCFKEYMELFFHLKFLKNHLQIEEAKNVTIGSWERVEVIFFDDEVGPGLPLWHPNGTILIDN